MVGTSFFKTLLGKTLKDDEGPTSEEIDREVENAITSIKAKKQDTVSATSLVRIAKSGDENDTARVFIMDLAPIFAVFGSHEGRLADRLRDKCGVVFDAQRRNEKDTGVLERDLFLMHFPNLPNAKAFQLSMLITNEIGKDILGDQFESMELKGLLTVAKPKDLADGDNEFCARKAQSVIKDGGETQDMGEPPEHAPNWVKLHWHSQMTRISEFIAQTQKKKETSPSKQDRPRDLWEKRDQRDRRDGQKAFTPPNRRRTFDRRGRGY